MEIKMRRFRQQLDRETTEKIFKTNTSGVLSLLGPDGYPYGLPVSYVYTDGKLYFHGAREGYKYECIRNCSNASFTVIDLDHQVPEQFTAYFRSAIAFGKVRIVEDPDEMRKAIEELAAKYVPDDKPGREKEIEREWNILGMIRFDVEKMTGKEAVELAECGSLEEKNQLLSKTGDGRDRLSF